MKIRFELSMQINSEWGMNRIYSGNHWNIRKSQAQQVHLMVKSAIRKQCKGAKLLTNPVSVRIWYNSHLDIDNHGYISKLIIDGMKGILLNDDSRRYVKELTQGFHTGDHQLVLVELEELI